MKKFLKKLLGIVFGLAMGASMALCVMPYVVPRYIDEPLWLFESMLIANMVYVLIVYGLTIALHELGHMIFGMLSGYEFVSYRIFNITLIRLQGRLKLKLFSLAGTGGQCLLKPPRWTEKGIPVKLYNLGGILVNAVCTIIALPFLFKVPLDSFGGMLLLSFMVLSAFSALLNGIPLGNNDGSNVLSLGKDINAVRAFWAQMEGNALMAEGTALRDIPAELYAVAPGADLTNPLIAASYASAAQIPLYHHRFEEADAAITDALERAGENLPPVLRTLLINERVWFELMHENRGEVLKALQDKAYVNFRKAMKNSISVIRVDYTRALADGKGPEAEKLKRRFEKLAKSYPFAQEIEEERYMMQLADKHFNN